MMIETFWSEEDGAFLCIAPDLPGCSAVGSTPSDAIQEMQDSISSWLQACAKLNVIVPAKPVSNPNGAC